MVVLNLVAWLLYVAVSVVRLWLGYEFGRAELNSPDWTERLLVLVEEVSGRVALLRGGGSRVA